MMNESQTNEQQLHPESMTQSKSAKDLPLKVSNNDNDDNQNNNKKMVKLLPHMIIEKKEKKNIDIKMKNEECVYCIYENDFCLSVYLSVCLCVHLSVCLSF